jgi:lysophospholipase L1-like esterase
VSHEPHRRFGFLRDSAISLVVAVALWAGCEVTLRAARPQVSRTEETDGLSRAVEDSVLGHRYRPGTRAIQRTPEFTAEYVIDADGRRVGTQFPDSLGVRVLVLGDSFAFGVGAAPADVWTSVLVRSLASRGLRVDLVNAGVEAYDTRAEAHSLFELAPVVRPDVVLLAFLANDVYTNRPLDAAPLHAADQPRGGGFELHSVAWAKRVVIQSDWLYSILFLVTPRKEYYATPVTERVTEQLGVTRDLIGKMDRYCRERGVDFAVVSIPQQFGVITTANGYRFRGVDPDLIDENLVGLARERDFPWIAMQRPLADAYRETGRDAYYRVDGHLTVEGNRLVGETVAEALAPVIERRARR